MKSKRVTTKITLSQEMDLELQKMAEEAERSKRRQASILIRRIIQLRKTNPEAAMALVSH
jgi:hypothetical protein